MKQVYDRDTPQTRYGKIRLRSLDDLDHRTHAAKRAAALVSGLEADAGGADQLSVAQRAIIQRAALCSAILEDREVLWLQGKEIDVTAYATIINCMRRLLESLNLHHGRIARDSPEDDACDRSCRTIAT
jgi:hypothetical protein